MKKVLIITHGFPGTGARGNVKLIKYLPRFGYEPIILTNRRKKDKFEDKVITKELKNICRIYKTICLNKSPFRIFSKFFNSWNTTIYFEKLFFIPDLYITWVPSAFFKGLQIIKRENVDAIITASPPESIHITGLLLSKATGVKLITDFRDLWTSKEIVNKPATKLHGLVIRKLEKIIYEKTDHIIANTYGNKVIYTNNFRIPEDKVTVITNGYDSEEIEENNSQVVNGSNKKITIGYMGHFDKRGFPWKDFLLTIIKMYQTYEGLSLHVNICGHVSDKARKFIVEHDLADCIHCHGVFPHFEAYNIIKQNDLLLLLMYETEYSKAIVPHKLYHYLGMLKPIMAIAEKNGEVADIIKTTRTGKVASINEFNGVFKMLVDYYNEWKDTGFVKYDPNREELEKYDIMKLTEKLSDTVKKCCSKN